MPGQRPGAADSFASQAHEARKAPWNRRSQEDQTKARRSRPKRHWRSQSVAQKAHEAQKAPLTPAIARRTIERAELCKPNGFSNPTRIFTDFFHLSASRPSRHMTRDQLPGPSWRRVPGQESITGTVVWRLIQRINRLNSHIGPQAQAYAQATGPQAIGPQDLGP